MFASAIFRWDIGSQKDYKHRGPLSKKYQFYDSSTPTVCKDGHLPFYSSLRNNVLPDDGRSEQPKHVVVSNNN